MSPRPRLLLIAYTFPPAPSAGAIRPGYLARYLPDYGWDVVALSRRSIRSGIADAVDSLPFRVRDTLLFPDASAAWLAGAFPAAHRLLREQPFDAILSTAHPPNVHLLASVLARQTGLPWIADYRDAWSGNPYLQRGRLRKAFEEHLERSSLRQAASITTISEPIAQQIRTIHKRNDVTAIPNAYDPAEWSALERNPSGRFDLVFTGSMYGGKRNPDLLFEAVRALSLGGEPAGTEARIHFYGSNNGSAVASAAAYNISLLVRDHGLQPRPVAMQVQRSSAVLLIFLSMDPRTSTEMGSKYLEYVGARRPIIAFGPPDSIMRPFVTKHRLGWFASTHEEAIAALRAAYSAFSLGSPDVHVDVNEIPTARMLANRFAKILDSSMQRPNLRSIA